MHMNTINALAVRKSLGKILKDMERKSAPVLVTRDRKPVAALVPFQLFKQRFVDVMAQDELDDLKRQLTRLQSPSTGGDTLASLAALREGRL